MIPTNESLRKAAVLVSALDVDAADTVLERMSPEHAALIRRVLLELPTVAPADEEAVIVEFMGRPTAVDEASGVELALSSDQPTILPFHADPRDKSSAAPFQFLQAADDHDLSELLSGERPQTVAVVVSHLPADQAARVLAALPQVLQTDVVRRLARLDETSPHVLAELEAALERRFQRRLPNGGRQALGVGAVRQILNQAAPETRGQWLTNLVQQDPKLAARLTRAPFTFLDLERLTDESLALVFDSIDEATAVAALAGSEPEWMTRLATVLPRAQGDRLRRQIDTLGPTRLSDVDAAQEATARAARDLDTLGRLRWRDRENNPASAAREVAVAA